MDLLECNDFKSITRPTAKNEQQSITRPQKETHLSASKQHVPTDGLEQQLTAIKDSLESLSDDFELMESLIDENFRETNSSSTDSKTIVDDEVSDIDPYLINENDNLSLPDNFVIDEDSPTSSIRNNFTSDKVNHNKQQKSNNDSRVYSGNIFKKSPLTNTKKISTAPSSAKPTSVVSHKITRDVAEKKIKNQRLTNKSLSSYSTEKLVKVERRDSVASLNKFSNADASTSVKNRKNSRGTKLEEHEQSKGDWFNINNEVSVIINLSVR